VAFANGAKAQDEPALAVTHTRLVRVTDNARIEQGRRLERIFMEEVGADQLTLSVSEHGMWIKCSLHLGRARDEQLEQVSVDFWENEITAPLMNGPLNLSQLLLISGLDFAAYRRNAPGSDSPTQMTVSLAISVSTLSAAAAAELLKCRSRCRTPKIRFGS
jgi:hypothetical protein